MQTIILIINEIVVYACHLLAVVVIAIGVAKALWIYLKDVLTPGRSDEAIRRGRTELGYAFSLGLGFLIGASILKTTLAPSWNDIGQLAAIIGIRTALNYLLLREIAIQSEGPADSSRLREFLRPRKPDRDDESSSTS